MNNDIMGEAERIACQRDSRNDVAETERLELIEIRDRVDARARRTGEEDAVELWVWARMIGHQILKRCPHDPDEYELLEISRWKTSGYVSAEMRCPHCDAKGGVDDPTIVRRLERRTLNA